MEEKQNPEDKLSAENELLRLKLELEHGMQANETSLPPDAENQWLNYIYNFEQQYKDAKRAKVYDLIGRPDFKKAEDLEEGDIEMELERLVEILNSQSIALDVICDYPVSVIYKFLTEELFEYETDDMSIPGMVTHFTYEEFHPNHAYDLERHSRDYAESIFSKKWNNEFSFFIASKIIEFNGKTFPKEVLSDKISAFQELHKNITLHDFTVKDLQFSLDDLKAVVETELKILFEFENGEPTEQIQSAKFYYQGEYWEFYRLELKGLNL